MSVESDRPPRPRAPAWSATHCVWCGAEWLGAYASHPCPPIVTNFQGIEVEP